MSTQLNRSIQDDFKGIFGIAPKISSGANRRIEIMSRFSSLPTDHDAIQNFDQVNMHLTSTYATRNSNNSSLGGDMLMWSPDDHTNQEYASRGAYDRYVWAGAFEERVSGNVFTHTTIEGSPTDGYMMIPSPYVDFEEGSMKFTGHVDKMDSIRLKIKSNGGIPANQFIPLFGYAYKHIGVPIKASNSSYDIHRSFNQWNWNNQGRSDYNLYHIRNSKDFEILGYGPPDSFITKGHNIPSTVAADSNNSYSYHNREYPWYVTKPFQNDYCRNAIIWFVYAHDGNGNGMLAMHPGESSEPPSGITSFYKLRPSNGYFGTKNGYFDWVQPYWYTEKLFQGANTLADIWNDIGPSGSWRPEMPFYGSYYTAEVGNSWRYAKYDPGINASWDPSIDSTEYFDAQVVSFFGDAELAFHQANFRRMWTHAHDGGVPWLTDVEFQSFSDLYQNHNTDTKNGDNTIFSDRYTYTQYQRVLRHPYHRGDSGTRSEFRFGNYIGSGLTSVDRGSHYQNTVKWPQNYAPSQVIAYGPTSNSDLSQETEILINVNSIRGGFKNEESYANAQGTSAAPPAPATIRLDSPTTFQQNLTSNKLLDHFGVHSRDEIYTGGYPNGQAVCLNYTGKILDFKFRDIPGQMYNDTYNSFYAAYAGEDFCGKTQKALVLRASHLGKIEISSFSIANYGIEDIWDPDYVTSDSRNEIVGGSTTFHKDYYRSSSDTEFLFSDDGFSYDPLENAKNTPSTNIEDPSNSWDNPEYLINNDLTLRSDLNAAGESNALYIKLNGTNALPQGAVDSDYEIQSFTINIKGVTLSSLDYHDLKFAIVDSTKAITLFSTNDNDPDSPHIGEVPLNNLTQSPPANGMYSIRFRTAISEPHYYSDIKDAYLKIWAETQNP